MIWVGKNKLLSNLNNVRAGDIYLGPATRSAMPGAVLAYLVAHNVRVLPSILSQQLSASKCAQTLILKEFMLPLTVPIYRRQDLLEAMLLFESSGIQEVVTKTDGMHCGHGVRRWSSLDEAYNQLAFENPFTQQVLQPFVKTFVDARIVMVGDELISAYIRENAGGFRRNLAIGGTSRPFTPKEELLEFCKKVCAKGDFPYAHIDVMVMPNEKTMYLEEISLHGGLKGASITLSELEEIKKIFLQKLAKATP